MKLLTTRIVRCKVTVDKPFAEDPLTDVIIEASAEIIRGNATRFEFGFFGTDGEPMDLSGVQSLNLKIQPSQTKDGVLADKTVTDIGTIADLADWNGGSACHAAFEFSGAEMNIPVPQSPRELWLAVSAIFTEGGKRTLTGGQILLHEDNTGSNATPPENPGAYLTLEQADARYPQPVAPLARSTPPTNGVLMVWKLNFFEVDPCSGDNFVTINFVCDEVNGGEPTAINVNFASGDDGSIMASTVFAALEANALITDVFLVVEVSEGVTLTKKSNGSSSVFSLEVADPNGIMPSGAVVAYEETAGVASNAVPAALGQMCIVTAQGGNTYPKIERDLFICVCLSPIVWAPPGYLYFNPNNGLWYRQAILDATIDFGLAYT